MDNRFQSDNVENGGMFSAEKINQISQYPAINSGSWSISMAPTVNSGLKISRNAWLTHTEPWISTTFLPGTNCQPSQSILHNKLRVFDRSHKGVINKEDVRDTTTRFFLANQPSSGPMRWSHAFINTIWSKPTIKISISDWSMDFSSRNFPKIPCQSCTNWGKLSSNFGIEWSFRYMSTLSHLDLCSAKASSFKGPMMPSTQPRS